MPANGSAGAALELLIHGLYQNYREGIVPRGLPSHDLAVTITKTSMGTPEAKVTECSDDSGAVAYSKSAKPVRGQADAANRRITDALGTPDARPEPDDETDGDRNRHPDGWQVKG